MMWAVYVDDPIGYRHLICECRDSGDAEQCVYQWARLSKFWEQWNLDYPRQELLWSVFPSRGNMPEIIRYAYRDGIPRMKEISRRDWEETYDHKWSHY